MSRKWKNGLRRLSRGNRVRQIVCRNAYQAVSLFAILHADQKRSLLVTLPIQITIAIHIELNNLAGVYNYCNVTSWTAINGTVLERKFQRGPVLYFSASQWLEKEPGEYVLSIGD